MAARRRLVLLGGLLGAAVAVALAGTGLVTRPAGAPVGPRPEPRAAARRPAQDGETLRPVAVNLAALSRARSEPADSERNPFKFRPRATAPLPVPAQPTATPPNQRSAPTAPVGPPAPPPIPLKFIGLVDKRDGTRIAVLSDGRRPIHGVEGEEIEGRYRILKIGTESIELAYLDGRGRQTIRLTGR
jgi:hypothetical protein